MNHIFENKWMVSIFAGLLLGLSFPPVNLSFLSIPAFMLFFHLIRLCDSNKQLAFYSYAGFLVWNVCTTYWLMMASVAAGIAANLANAVLMTIPLVMMRFFQNKYQSKLLIVLLQASVWTSYEFLHHHWDLAWPWLAIGNAWSSHVMLIQYISITGHLGITFWVIVTASFSYLALTSEKKYRYIALGSLCIIPISSIIFFLTEEPSTLNTNHTSVTVIQPNHDSYQPYAGMSGTHEIIDSLFSTTNTYRSNYSKLIVWPENAIERAVLMESTHLNRIADSAKAWNTSFIVGTGLITLYPDDPPLLTRGLYRKTPYNIFNSAFLVNNTGTTSRYDKHKLVPIVERVPFLNILTTLDYFNWVNWGKIAGFGKGNSVDMLVASDFTTNGLICYDSVYPSWVRAFVNKGADFLTIITNDGWWGNSSGHYQHFEYARLRAIEFNRWVVRSANNGTSGIIRPNGTIHHKTEYWTKTGFNSNIPHIKENTVYAKYGDWLSYFTLAITLLFSVFGLWNKKNLLSR